MSRPLRATMAAGIALFNAHLRVANRIYVRSQQMTWGLVIE